MATTGDMKEGPEIAIWKYHLQVRSQQILNIPMPCHTVSVGLDAAGALCLWAFARTDNKDQMPKKIRVVGTGNPMPKAEYIELSEWRHLGTVNQRGFIWHVFEERP